MRKHNEGFSLVEIVVAIAILGLIVVPCGSALLMSIRINEKAQQMMQAQLAVSSAVETLMAEGIEESVVVDGQFTSNYEEEGKVPYDYYTVDDSGLITDKNVDRFGAVLVSVKPTAPGMYYTVKVTDNNLLVEIETTIRAKGGGGQ